MHLSTFLLATALVSFAEARSHSYSHNHHQHHHHHRREHDHSHRRMRRERASSADQHQQPYFDDSDPNYNITVLNAQLNGGGMTRSDHWSGSNFFDGWNFFSNSDPTHGAVNYLPADKAFGSGLAYVQQDGVAVMRVDNTNDLPYGQSRDSIRISTAKTYEGGLFVLDVASVPFGMGVWPAWWTVGPDWPNNGEIDIFEGVHMGPVNQYTLHTAAGCHIDTAPQTSDGGVNWPLSTSGQLGLTDCGPSPQNNGCAWKDLDEASYGPKMNAQGGAVIAMLWSPDGIKIWNFPRWAVPADLSGSNPTPNPSAWPRQYYKAYWSKAGCDPTKYFHQHSIVLDITLCGDWAGSSYPGDCKAQVMKGSNFGDAIWKINSVSVYQ